MTTIKEEIENLVSIMPDKLVFSTKWFKDTLHGLYGRPRDSYIPSDYCENICNKGIEKWKDRPVYFHAEPELGMYRKL